MNTLLPVLKTLQVHSNQMLLINCIEEKCDLPLPVSNLSLCLSTGLSVGHTCLTMNYYTTKLQL